MFEHWISFLFRAFNSVFFSVTSYHSAWTLTCGEGNVEAEYTRFVTMVEPWAAKLCNKEDAAIALHDSRFLGYDLKVREGTSPPLMWTCRTVKLGFHLLSDMPHRPSMLLATQGYNERIPYPNPGWFCCPLNMGFRWVGSRTC